MPCRFPWTATVGSVQMVDEIDELVLGRTRDRRSGRSTTRFCTTPSISWAPRHHCVDLAAGTARQDKEVIVTDRGTPVARLLSVDTAPLLDQLTQRGVLSKPRRAERPAEQSAARIRADGPVAELVSEQRR